MEEIKNDKIIQEEPEQVTLPDNPLLGMTNLRADVSFFIPKATAPTYVPRTPIEHFYLYNNGGTRRLYVYDKTAGTWHYSSLT